MRRCLILATAAFVVGSALLAAPAAAIYPPGKWRTHPLQVSYDMSFVAGAGPYAATATSTTVRGLNATSGAVLWSAPISCDPVSQVAAVGPDTFVVSCPDTVYGLRFASGEIAWSHKFGDLPGYGPTVPDNPNVVQTPPPVAPLLAGTGDQAGLVALALYYQDYSKPEPMLIVAIDAASGQLIGGYRTCPTTDVGQAALVGNGTILVACPTQGAVHGLRLDIGKVATSPQAALVPVFVQRFVPQSLLAVTGVGRVAAIVSVVTPAVSPTPASADVVGVRRVDMFSGAATNLTVVNAPTTFGTTTPLAAMTCPTVLAAATGTTVYIAELSSTVATFAANSHSVSSARSSDGCAYNALTAVPSATATTRPSSFDPMAQFIAFQSGCVSSGSAGVFDIIEPNPSVALRSSIASSGAGYGGSPDPFRLIVDRAHNLVIVPGLNALTSWYVDPKTGNATLGFTDNQNVGGAAVLGDSCVVGLRGDGTIAFDIATPSVWQFPTGASNTPPMVSRDGVTFVVTNPGGVQAVGPDGKLLWNTRYAFSALDVVQGFFVLGRQFVVVFVGTTAIGFDQRTGAFAFDRDMSGGRTCWGETLSGTVQPVELASGRSVLLLPPTFDGFTPGSPVCGFIFREDLVTVPVVIASPAAVTSNGDSFFLLQQASITAIDGWTGATSWSMPLSLPSVSRYSFSATENLVYVSPSSSATGNGILCLSAKYGQTLWNQPHYIAPQVGVYSSNNAALPLVGDDVVALQTIASAGSALTAVRTTFDASSNPTPGPLWAFPVASPQAVNNVAIANGVIAVNLADGSTRGLDAANGTQRWSYKSTYAACTRASAAFGGSVVELSCGDMTDFVAADVGALAFFIAKVYSPLVTGPTVVVNGQSVINGVQIPARLIAGFAAETVPLPTVAPFVLPPNYQPPTPAPIPVPEINEKGLKPLVAAAWHFQPPAEGYSSNFATAKKSYNETLFGANESHVMWLNIVDGAIKASAPLPCIVHGNVPPYVYATPSAFIVHCAMPARIFAYTSDPSAGQKWSAAIPSQGSAPQVLFYADGPAGETDGFAVVNNGAVPPINYVVRMTDGSVSAIATTAGTVFKPTPGAGVLCVAATNGNVTMFGFDGRPMWSRADAVAQGSSVVDGVAISTDEAVFLSSVPSLRVTLVRRATTPPGWMHVLSFSSTQGVLAVPPVAQPQYILAGDTSTDMVRSLKVADGSVAWTFAGDGHGFISQSLQLTASPSCAVVTGMINFITPYIPSTKRYFCLDAADGSVRINTTGTGRGFDAKAFVDETLGAETPIMITQYRQFRINVTSGEYLWDIENSVVSGSFGVSNTAAFGPMAFYNAFGASVDGILVDAPAKRTGYNLASGSSQQTNFVRIGTDRVAMLVGHLLFMTEVASPTADAQVLWRVAVPGTEAPGYSGFTAVVELGMWDFKNHIGVLRATEILFVEADTGNITVSIPLLSLTSKCIPASGTTQLGLTSVGGEILATYGTCGYFLSLSGAVERTFTMPNVPVKPPVAIGNTIVVHAVPYQSSAFQNGGTLLGVDRVSQKVLWSASAAGFTSTSPTNFVYTATESVLTSRFIETGELVWSLTLPTPGHGGQIDSVKAPATINGTTAVMLTNWAGPTRNNHFTLSVLFIDTTLTLAPGVPRIQKTLTLSQFGNGQYQEGPPPFVTRYGIVLVLSVQTFGINAATGEVAWRFGSSCTTLDVADRVATMVCNGVVMLDVVTGEVLSQTGVTIGSSGLTPQVYTLTPAGFNVDTDLPTLAYNNYFDVFITQPRRVRSVVPTPSQGAPTLMPGPLPPGFHPPHKTPTQPAPTTAFPKVGAPLSVLQTYPANADSDPQPLALTDTDQYFYRSSTQELSRYNMVSKAVVWAVPGPSSDVCSNGVFTSTAGLAGDVLTINCQGTFILYSAINGTILYTTAPMALVNAVESFGPVMTVPGIDIACTPFQTETVVGCLCIRPGQQFMVNGTLAPFSNDDTFTQMAQASPGVAMVTFVAGEALWFDTATGAITSRAVPPGAANVQVTVSISNDSAVLALLLPNPSNGSRTVAYVYDVRTAQLMSTSLLNTVAPVGFGFHVVNLFHREAATTCTLLVPPQYVILTPPPVYAFALAFGPTPINGNVTVDRPIWAKLPFSAAQFNDVDSFAVVNAGPYAIAVAGRFVALVDVANGNVLQSTTADFNNEDVTSTLALPSAGLVFFGTQQTTWVVDVAKNGTIGIAEGATKGIGYRVLSNSAGVVTFVTCDIQCKVLQIASVASTWGVGAGGSQASTGVIGTNTKGDLLVAALENSEALNIGGLDATTGEARWTAGLGDAVGLPVYVPGLDLVVSFSSQASTAWVASAANGTLLGVASIPMCELSSSQGAAQTAVASGAAVYFAGSSGCLYRLDLAAPRQPTVATLATVAGGGQPAFADGGLVLWIDSVGLLWAFDGDSGAQAWTHQLDNEGNYRVPVVYGAVVAVTRNPYEIDMLDRATGGLVRRVRENAAYTFGPLIAYNGFVWATCTTGVLRVAVAADGPAPLLVPGIASVGKKASPFNAPPAVSADGVLVYATAYGAAAIDTTSGTRLWAAALSRPQFFFGTDARRVTPFAVADGVVAGDVGFGVETRSLATGAVLSTWSGNQNSINLGTSVTVHRSPGSATSFVVATTGQVSARLLGQQATSAPVVTSAAPATAPSGTVPPPTDAPTLAPGVFRPSAGCLARTSAALPVFTRCVNDRVIAATLAAAGSATVADCGAAASQLTGCVEEFAAMLLQCPAAVDFGRQVMAAVADAQGFALCSGASGPACATTGGKAAYCAALQLPSWVAGLGPVTLPAGYSGFPAVPSFSASTTPAPSTTTTAVPSTTSTTSTTTAPATTTTTMTTVTTTSAPTTTPPATTTQTAAPGTGTTTHASGTTTTTSAPQSTEPIHSATSPPMTGQVPVGEVLEVVLLPDTPRPSDVDFVMGLQKALGLSAAPYVRVLPPLQDVANVVSFFFWGYDIAALTNQTLLLPPSRLRADLNASSVFVAGSAPPPAPTQPAPKATTWAIALIAVFGATTAILALVVVVKRRAVFGSATGDIGDDDYAAPITSDANSMASGRINTGGDYERYEDRA